MHRTRCPPVALTAQAGFDDSRLVEQLGGLRRRQAFPRLGLHLPDEVGQSTTGGGDIALLDRLEGGLQLLIQAGLQALGEVEAVDHVDHDRQAVGRGHFKGPDVARGPLRSTDAALVGRAGGRATAARRDMVDGRAVGFQGESLGRAPVILQAVGIELGVGVLQVACASKAAVRPALQVVALVGQGSEVSAVAPRVVGHDAPANGHRAAQVVVEAAALAAGSGVAGEGAVADSHRAAIVEEAAAAEAAEAGSGVVGERAVADAHRASIVEEAAAERTTVGSGVAGEGAVRYGRRA